MRFMLVPALSRYIVGKEILFSKVRGSLFAFLSTTATTLFGKKKHGSTIFVEMPKSR